MSDLVDWLKGRSGNAGEKIRLISHFGHGIDAPLLFNSLKKFGDNFVHIERDLVFCDSFKVIQKQLPGLQSYTLSSLQNRDTTGDAMEDAMDLKTLFDGYQFSEEDLARYDKTLLPEKIETLEQKV